MIDLSPHLTPLTFGDAAHLLRRTTLNPSWDQISRCVGRTASAVVSEMLAAKEPAPAEPSWANDPPEFTDFGTAAKLWPELQQWWADVAIRRASLRERMVMLWHNTFTTDYITAYYAQWMVGQGRLLRANAYDFRALATGIIADPAMLRYLNGDQSIKGNPNENFAREWFELFTLGVGNYTERDIVEASRAFTGWRISGLKGTYTRGLADLGEKTILGQTGPWEWSDVVRITLDNPACARWVSAKLLRTFVTYYPSPEDIEALAVLVRANNYDLSKVLSILLTSTGFFDVSIRGSLIKSPADLILGLASICGAQAIERAYIVASMTRLSQEPFYPPTVQGWQGHHSWITTSTFPLRQRFAESFIDGKQSGVATRLLDTAGKTLTPDVVAVVRSLPNPQDAVKVVEHIAALMLPVPTTQQQRDVLLEIMLAGAQVYEWDVNAPSAVQRVKFLMQAIVRMPEYQLM